MTRSSVLDAGHAAGTYMAASDGLGVSGLPALLVGFGLALLLGFNSLHSNKMINP